MVNTTINNNGGVESRLLNNTFRKNLIGLQVLIEDKSEYSPYYFNIIRKPQEFRLGGNIFEFAPPRNRFKLNTQIIFEAVDSQNNPLAYEILPQKEGSSTIRMCVFIYDTNVAGPGVISIIGEALVDECGCPVPEDWEDKPNCRWTSITPVITDDVSDILEYDTAPSVTITEAKIPWQHQTFEDVYVTNPDNPGSAYTVTGSYVSKYDSTPTGSAGFRGGQGTGKFIYTKSPVLNAGVEEAVIEVYTGNLRFSSSMVGGTLNVSGGNNNHIDLSSQDPYYEANAKGQQGFKPNYSPSIVSVISSTKAVVSPWYSYTPWVNNRENSYDTPRPANAFTAPLGTIIKWTETSASIGYTDPTIADPPGAMVSVEKTTEQHTSYANIAINNLKPLCGVATAVEVFIKSTRIEGPITKLTEFPIELTNLNVDNTKTTSAGNNREFTSIGTFSNQASITEYWDMIGNIGDDTTNLPTYNTSVLMNSVHLTTLNNGLEQALSNRAIFRNQNTNSSAGDVSFTLIKGTSYFINFDAVGATGTNDAAGHKYGTVLPLLELFISGSGGNHGVDPTNKLVRSEEVLGEYVGKLHNTVNSNQQYLGNSFEYKAVSDGKVNINFVLRSGDWFLRDITVTAGPPNQAPAVSGRTPNYTTALVPMPPITHFNDSYIFELRYKNHRAISKKVSLCGPVQFEGNDPSAFLAGQPNSTVLMPWFNGINALTSSKQVHITGSLFVSGNIYSNEFHTNIVSSSILFEEGDTLFGNSLDDKHATTGSMYITSSYIQKETNHFIIQRPENKTIPSINDHEYFEILKGQVTHSGDLKVINTGTPPRAFYVTKGNVTASGAIRVESGVPNFPLLHITSSTTKFIDFQNGSGDTVFGLLTATKGDSAARKLYFYDHGGEHIAGTGTNLILTAGTDIQLNPGTAVLVDSDKPIRFRDDETAIHSSTGGQLDIDADEELELTAAVVDINASTGLDLVGANLNSDWTVNTNKKIQLRNTGIYIQSPSTGHLNIVADKGINLTGGHVTASGADASIAKRANISASGLLYFSASHVVPAASITNQGVLVYDSGSGRVYMTGSYGGGSSGGGEKRPVTAGGNSLADGETLAFVAAGGMTIAESGGQVTLTSANDNTNTLTTFTVSATTDTTATTISHGDDLMFTAGAGITAETTADGTVTITNTKPSDNNFTDADHTKLDLFDAIKITRADLSGSFTEVSTSISVTTKANTDRLSTVGEGVTIQPVLTEGAFVDGDKTKLDLYDAIKITRADLSGSFQPFSSSLAATSNSLAAASKSLDTRVKASTATLAGVTVNITDDMVVDWTTGRGDTNIHSGNYDNDNTTTTADVTSAGALMDSEVGDLDGIKSLTVPNNTTITANGILDWTSNIEGATVHAGNVAATGDATGLSGTPEITITNVTISSAAGVSPIKFSSINLGSGEGTELTPLAIDSVGRLRTTTNLVDGGGGHGKGLWRGSPSVYIASGSLTFYSGSATSSYGSMATSSAIFDMVYDKSGDASSFVMSGSQSAKLYFSGSTSGKIGIGTTDPQAAFEVAADEHVFRRRETLIGMKINSEGNVESFNKDSAFAATGSEVILTYTAGGRTTVTAAAIRAVFGDNAIAEDADEAARLAFFDALKPDAQAKLLHFLEKTGEFGVGADQIGDIVGSVKWLVSSGSTGASISEDGFDRRRSGELAAIRTQITDADDTGAVGQLQIRTSTGKSSGAVTRIELKPNGQMIHSGSINTYRNNTLFIGETVEDGYDRPISFRHSTAPFIMGIDDSQDRFVIHSANAFATTSDLEIDSSGNVAFANGNITVAGNITANGNIIGDDATDITNIESIFCDNIVHDGDTDTKIAFGTDTITLSAGGADLVTLTEAATNTIALGAAISTHVTASGNVSASGLVQGGSVRANDLTAGRVAFAGTAGLLVDDSDLTFAGATLTATNIAAFNLTGKLTAGNGVEIEGNAFDINGGTIDGVTSVVIAEEGTIDARAGALATSAAQNLAIVQGAGANVDIGTFSLTANTLVSDVATGTAPLTVTSTTRVANLQASTVGTIAGLAPNTATTQAAQGNITSVGTLTNIITSGHVTASGNISSSKAVIALSASIAGPIRGKSLQLYNANFKGNLGTAEVYIPLAAQPDEQTGGAGMKEHTTIIMPCGGRVKEIILRQHWTSTITTSDDISWKMYTRATGTRMNGSTQVGDTITMVNPTQAAEDANNTRTTGELDSTYHFDKYDALAISMQWASTGPTNNADRIYITVVVEHDWETIGY